ncbi:hypothetical protein DL766_004137 [Monosporascus sp. MC13-8B]|uniref:Uncharacterized protein n=1 Tax=Monosporascus cannonballus TaxID=155416 RepID=A0ABY0H4G5_9PEZI|nr:hypothetical protein DL762_005947 [Monosporascus cannonballus]RYP01656.1 hypothetical protein DL763_000045 [Monosporascus cannonballus]RYP32027.1 hypothetical protein DL766_004137 [Monosporascus sp. MC13-8B]
MNKVHRRASIRKPAGASVVACCAYFSTKGHRVFLEDNNFEELQHTTSNVLAQFSNGPFSSSVTDLRDPQQIKDVVSQAGALFDSRLDVLVNNAAFTGGVGIPSETLTLEEDWNKSLATNSTAPMLMTQACLPLLKVQQGQPHGGTIINMSSTRARQSEPDSEGYGATKAGLIGLTQSLASSLAPMGFMANTILPGGST